MKTNRMASMGKALLIGMVVAFSAFSQKQQDEVPGDHFSLEGALELFKKSTSPEDFERLLNVEDSKVNNLDLNGDGDIDYIRVIDRQEGSVHLFILQAVVSETESQDVAVIELEKLSNGKAVLQITGDEDIYGMETIIEPTEEVFVNAGTSTRQVVVNVWTWPAVQYVYDPYYSPWISPWSWGLRPWYWRPWRPVAWVVYDPWWTPYRPYYARCHYHRIGYAPTYYRPYRTTSYAVHNRHRDQVERYRSSRSDWSNNDRRSYQENHSGRNDSGSGSHGRTRPSESRNRTWEWNSPSNQERSQPRERTYQERSRPSSGQSSGWTRPSGRTREVNQSSGNFWRNSGNSSRQQQQRTYHRQSSERSTGMGNRPAMRSGSGSAGSSSGQRSGSHHRGRD